MSHVCHTEIDETRIFMGIYTIVETWCDRRKTQSLPRKNGALVRSSMPILGKFKS